MMNPSFIDLRQISLVIASTFGASLLHAGPIVIDDFDVTFSPTGTVSEISGSMIGGELDMRTGEDLVPEIEFSGGRLKVDSEVEPYTLSLTYDGIDDLDGPSPPYNYGLSVDLTGGGTNDRIRVHLPVMSGNIDIYLTFYTDENNYNGVRFTPTAPGIFEKEFEDMGRSFGTIDFANVTRITCSIQNIHIGDTFELDRIEATGFVQPPDPEDVAEPQPSVPPTATLKKISKLKKKLKRAKKSGQKAKAKKFKKQIKKLSSQL